MDARGMTEADLVEGAHRRSMDELTVWPFDSERCRVLKEGES